MKEGDALVPMAPDKVADPQRYEERDELTDEITRVIDVDKDDAAFILGRGGATKRKVARVAESEIELDEHTLTITIVGTKEACDKSECYIGFVKQQRLGESRASSRDRRDPSRASLVARRRAVVPS